MRVSALNADALRTHPYALAGAQAKSQKGARSPFLPAAHRRHGAHAQAERVGDDARARLGGQPLHQLEHAQVADLVVLAEAADAVERVGVEAGGYGGGGGDDGVRCGCGRAAAELMGGS